MRTLSVAILLTFLTACAGVSDRVSDGTGTTLAERCQNYRTAVSAARLLPKSVDRDRRIAVYEVLLANCPKAE